MLRWWIIFTEEARDQNLNATTATWTPTVQMLTVQTPRGESTGPHIIKTFEQYEAGLPQQDYRQVESKLDYPTHELLWWHYKLGHESFKHLQWMAKSGILPKHHAACRVPQWAACYYGQSIQETVERKGCE
jgi:hypothetical protein